MVLFVLFTLHPIDFFWILFCQFKKEKKNFSSKDYEIYPNQRYVRRWNQIIDCRPNKIKEAIVDNVRTTQVVKQSLKSNRRLYKP